MIFGRRAMFALVAGGLGLAAALPAAAANSIFLKIPGITGPATAQGFRGDIELLAYSQGFSNSQLLSSGGGGAGKTTCGLINVQKQLDVTSTFFLKTVTTAQHIPSVTIFFTDTGANGNVVTPYTITLTNVLVTAVSQGDTAGRATGLNVTEQIALIAERLQFTFASNAAGGTQTVGWDCLTNSPI